MGYCIFFLVYLQKKRKKKDIPSAPVGPEGKVLTENKSKNKIDNVESTTDRRSIHFDKDSNKDSSLQQHYMKKVDSTAR